MTSIIQRMVDAMIPVFCDNGMPISDPRTGCLDDVERERWNAIVDAARAALEAVRELSDSQKAAAWPGFREIDWPQGVYCWQAVIDEALK